MVDNMAIPEAIPKIEQNRVSWFDKLTTNGSAPFVLSLSKDAPRPSLNFGTGSLVSHCGKRSYLRGHVGCHSESL
jgi:hypothetical protein